MIEIKLDLTINICIMVVRSDTDLVETANSCQYNAILELLHVFPGLLYDCWIRRAIVLTVPRWLFAFMGCWWKLVELLGSL